MTRMVIALAVLAMQVRVARADSPIRVDRGFAVAVVIPDGLYILDHDATVPIPSLRVGFTVSPRVMIEAGAGYVPMGHGARVAIAHAGARYVFHDGAMTPYAMARLGIFDDAPDEGTPASYPFAVIGAGFEYAGRSGFTAWIELGPGLASYESNGERSTELCVFGSLGLGYRFRTR